MAIFFTGAIISIIYIVNKLKHDQRQFLRNIIAVPGFTVAWSAYIGIGFRKEIKKIYCGRR